MSFNDCLVSSPAQSLPRPRKPDVSAVMPALRDHYGDNLLGVILGVQAATLHWKHQPQPVARLAYLLHRVTFQPGEPMTALELICLGKYGTRPQAPVANPAEVCKKPNEFSGEMDWQI